MENRYFANFLGDLIRVSQFVKGIGRDQAFSGSMMNWKWKKVSQMEKSEQLINFYYGRFTKHFNSALFEEKEDVEFCKSSVQCY